jgi:hypothetical protein
VTSVFGRTAAVTAQANDYTWAQIDKTTSSLADITTRSAGDLSSGNLGIARMPVGGAWSLTSDLNIDSNTFVVDQLNNRVGIGNSAPAVALDVNGDVRVMAQGDVRFADSDSSNFVAFQAPAVVASDVTWTLPAADGTIGQVLSTNGTATLSWATPSSAVTSVFGRTAAVTAQAGDYTWADITKTVSSLADINQRSAGDLSSGNLNIARMPTGGAWTLGSDLNIDSNTLVVDFTLNRVGIGNSAPAVALDVSGDVRVRAQGDVRFADSDSSNFVAFQAPAAVTADVTWTLPAADGTIGQVLSTNGTATLSWTGGGGPTTTYGDLYVTAGAAGQVLNAVAGTFDKLTAFTNVGLLNNTTPSAVNDNITVLQAGTYLINVSASFFGTNNTLFTLRVYQNAAGLNNLTGRMSTTSATNRGSVSISGIASLAANDTVEVEATGDVGGRTITIVDANLSVVKIN